MAEGYSPRPLESVISGIKCNVFTKTLSQNSSDTIESLGIVSRDGRPVFIVLSPNVTFSDKSSAYVAFQLSDGRYCITKFYGKESESGIVAIIDSNGVLKNGYSSGLYTYVMYFKIE